MHRHTAAVALVPDLMDRSRIAGAASRAGVALEFAADAAALATRCAVGEAPPLAVVDLSRPGALDAFRRLPDEVDAVGFAPHVDDDVLTAAAAGAAAGRRQVLPRSRFFRRLPEILSGSAAASDGSEADA
ncbi:MAG TPA: hypothetical protein DEP66_07465 [Acidimicrobiaceae bacterium]|nr:hypothetical protein [Acidimicrobiaceae bacterium]HCB38013.1 hypothetical protein [Acidimicrobiaceae bacterium]